MVVVRAESYISVLELRVGPIDKADHIASELCPRDLIISVEIESQFDAFQAESRQWLLLRGLLFQLGILDLGAAEEKLIKFIVRRYHRWQRLIQTLDGSEID